MNAKSACSPSPNPLVPLGPPADGDPPAPEFDPVPLRRRVDGWTPERQRAYVEHLAETLCPETAAALVGMSAESARQLRRRPGAEGFNAACDAALRRGLSERGRAALIDEAVNGRLVRRFYHGELISEERVRSPRLLLALLEKAEALFAGPGAAESEAVAADWHGAMERLESGALDGGYRLWRDRDGAWWTSFPPPPGFQGEAGDPLNPNFRRRLTEAEERALSAKETARLEEGAAARDAFFGFKPTRGITYRRIRSKGRD
ncbi:MAG TPA: hypothetical protein VEA61_06915 [Allosphingosinicella sp.]|nr:hypothetical protein [Allosphingosinicella sp.]